MADFVCEAVSLRVCVLPKIWSTSDIRCAPNTHFRIADARVKRCKSTIFNSNDTFIRDFLTVEAIFNIRILLTSLTLLPKFCFLLKSNPYTIKISQKKNITFIKDVLQLSRVLHIKISYEREL